MQWPRGEKKADDLGCEEASQVETLLFSSIVCGKRWEMNSPLLLRQMNLIAAHSVTPTAALGNDGAP